MELTEIEKAYLLKIYRTPGAKVLCDELGANDLESAFILAAKGFLAPLRKETGLWLVLTLEGLTEAETLK